jgi:hypothetical protein
MLGYESVGSTLNSIVVSEPMVVLPRRAILRMRQNPPSSRENSGGVEDGNVRLLLLFSSL